MSFILRHPVLKNAIEKLTYHRLFCHFPARRKMSTVLAHFGHRIIFGGQKMFFLSCSEKKQKIFFHAQKRGKKYSFVLRKETNFFSCWEKRHSNPVKTRHQTALPDHKKFYFYLRNVRFTKIFTKPSHWWFRSRPFLGYKIDYISWVTRSMSVFYA